MNDVAGAIWIIPQDQKLFVGTVDTTYSAIKTQCALRTFAVKDLLRFSGIWGLV
jgi:hypothetical protein